MSSMGVTNFSAGYSVASAEKLTTDCNKRFLTAFRWPLKEFWPGSNGAVIGDTIGDTLFKF